MAEPVSTWVQEILELSPRQSPRLVTKLKIPPLPFSSPGYQFCTVEYLISYRRCGRSSWLSSVCRRYARLDHEFSFRLVTSSIVREESKTDEEADTPSVIAPRELVTRPHVAGSATVRKRMVGGSTRCYQKTYGYVWLYEDEIRSVEGPEAGRGGPEGTAPGSRLNR